MWSSCRGNALVRKVMRYEYFWPSMRKDARDMVRTCHQCQIHDNDHYVAQNEYHSLLSSIWFAQWGMDLLGPFPKAKSGKEYLVVAIYFTRWVEVVALGSITSKQVQNFFWEDIICHYGIPKILIKDNMKQFDAKSFKEFCLELGIEQRFVSIAHMQTNGLAEITNRTIL